MSEDKAPRTKIAQAVLPVAMMVALFILTIGLALIVAPLYLRQGLQAFGEEGAKNPLIAVYYLVMILVVTGIILLLRKFLKKKKRRFLKYVLGAAVLISTYAVLWPLLSAAVYGLPPQWDSANLEYPGPVDGIPPHLLLYEDRAVVIDRNGMTVQSIDSEGPPTAFSGVLSIRNGSRLDLYTRSSGPTYMLEHELKGRADARISSAALIRSGPLSGRMAISLTSGNETSYLILSKIVDGGATMSVQGINDTSLHFVDTPSEDMPSSTLLAYSSVHLLGVSLNASGHLDIVERQQLDGTVLWVHHHDEAYLIGTQNGLWVKEGSGPAEKALSIFMPRRSLCYIASSGSEREILAIKGYSLHVISGGDHDIYSLSGSDAVLMFSEGPSGRISIISGSVIESGSLPDQRNTSPVHIASFALSAGLVILLFWRPKWYLVDLAGILMGAGVLSLIGISLSILPLILLLILLAVYDFISVYKTKHMLTLAESVVESKLPILLVFPMRPDYRYEEEKDILDRSKPRQAMFMGLGDVIIPGTLIISASTFLADRGGASIMGIPPQLTVALFSMAGLFIGFSGLMYLVLKGKAHAGLPLLNSGTILGFLIGELIVFGRIILL